MRKSYGAQGDRAQLLSVFASTIPTNVDLQDLVRSLHRTGRRARPCGTLVPLGRAEQRSAQVPPAITMYALDGISAKQRHFDAAPNWPAAQSPAPVLS